METRTEKNSTNRYLRIFGGSANKKLAEKIAEYVGTPLGKSTIGKYIDGETKIQLQENVREKDVFVIQPTCPPAVNDNLVEIILLISTLRRSSARRITAVIPYFGYCRQDRKFRGRVPIAASDVARLLEAAGVDRVVVVDLHSGQLQGFFGPRTPCDNLESAGVAAKYFLNSKDIGKNTVIVSPDAGGVHRAKKFRDTLQKMGVEADLVIIIKQRSENDSINLVDLIGEVVGKTSIIVDDIVDTAGTMTAAVLKLRSAGAKTILAYATHGLFSGNALKLIEESPLEKLVVTDTVPLPEDLLSVSGIKKSKIVQISVASCLAEAIERIHRRKSLSEMFENYSLPAEK